MPKKHKKAYEVVKTEEFIQQFHDIRKRYPKSTDLINAIVWALERHPHKFENITQDYYHWITDELANAEYPTVKVLYKIIDQDSKVIMMAVEEI